MLTRGITFDEATAPIKSTHKGVWWELVARPDDVPEEEDTKFRETFRELAEVSHESLRQGLQLAIEQEVQTHKGARQRPDFLQEVS